MSIQLMRLDRSRLQSLPQRCEQVRQQFRSIIDSSSALSDPGFPLPGVVVTMADDYESAHITYRKLAVDLILTHAKVEGVVVGKVTARLTRHPLIKDEPVELGSFTLQRSGETDLVVAEPGDERYLHDQVVALLMTLVERAVYFDPKARALPAVAAVFP